MYSVQLVDTRVQLMSKMHNVQCTVCSVQCSVYSVQGAVCSVPCALHIALHIVQCQTNAWPKPGLQSTISLCQRSFQVIVEENSIFSVNRSVDRLGGFPILLMIEISGFCGLTPFA